jgi:hypothetical protein
MCTLLLIAMRTLSCVHGDAPHCVVRRPRGSFGVHCVMLLAVMCTLLDTAMCTRPCAHCHVYTVTFDTVKCTLLDTVLCTLSCVHCGAHCNVYTVLCSASSPVSQVVVPRLPSPPSVQWGPVYQAAVIIEAFFFASSPVYQGGPTTAGPRPPSPPSVKRGRVHQVIIEAISQAALRTPASGP